MLRVLEIDDCPDENEENGSDGELHSFFQVSVRWKLEFGVEYLLSDSRCVNDVV
jgi:hypothetical protein